MTKELIARVQKFTLWEFDFDFGNSTENKFKFLHVTGNILWSNDKVFKVDIKNILDNTMEQQVTGKRGIVKSTPFTMTDGDRKGR